MLWAKDARSKILSAQPDLDFASVSRKLGEMWAKVPTNQKYNFKRRAKRMTSENKNSSKKALQSEANETLLPFEIIWLS